MAAPMVTLVAALMEMEASTDISVASLGCNGCQAACRVHGQAAATVWASAQQHIAGGQGQRASSCSDGQVSSSGSEGESGGR